MERIFILVGLLLSLNDDLQLTLGNFPAESDKQKNENWHRQTLKKVECCLRVWEKLQKMD